MTYNLFIDDERVPMDVKWRTPGERYMYLTYEWVIARNWVEVLELVVSFGFPKLISFDHDLGKNEKTGYEIAQRLCSMVMDGDPLPDEFDYLVHSKNPVGAENIRQYMNNFLKHIGR